MICVLKILSNCVPCQEEILPLAHCDCSLIQLSPLSCSATLAACGEQGGKMMCWDKGLKGQKNRRQDHVGQTSLSQEPLSLLCPHDMFSPQAPSFFRPTSWKTGTGRAGTFTGVSRLNLPDYLFERQVLWVDKLLPGLQNHPLKWFRSGQSKQTC